MGSNWDLAQVNIARLLEPLDSQRLAGFVEALEEVNASVDAAPGFVWRLKSEDGNATSIRAFEWHEAGSAGVIVNLSTWESPEALKRYVYSAPHVDTAPDPRPSHSMPLSMTPRHLLAAIGDSGGSATDVD